MRHQTTTKKERQRIPTVILGNKIKTLIKAFKDKNVLWEQNDFGKKDDWMSILNTRMNKLKQQDDEYGVKKVAEIDEDADDKYLNALETGLLKPYKDTDDLHCCLIAMLGRVLGYRGGKEISKALWKDFEFKPPTEKIPAPVLVGRPGEGWDKSNQLCLNKCVYLRKERPHVAEDKENPWCIYKLMKHYRDMCHPEQERLFCYSNKNRTKDNPYRISKNMVIGPNYL